MKRNKPPSKKKGEMTSKSKKKKLEFIIESLSHGWLPEERETLILIDRAGGRVHFETSVPSTARRWFRNLWGDPEVKWDNKADTLKFSVPREYCRKSDLMIKAEYREYDEDNS